MKVVIALLFILHGLITAAFSGGSFKPWPPVENPGWLNFWPTRMGQSWLFPGAVAESLPVMLLGGILFLFSGVALVAAGLGLLGWIIPQAVWPLLAALGAAGCLLMLLINFHPFYLVGILGNAAILYSLLVAHWPSFMVLEVS
jgi:hypothetical protein